MELRHNLPVVRILYFVWVIFGMLSIMYIPSQLIDFSDALVTAKQISEGETIFRVGVLGRLVTQLLFLVVVWYLYKIFKEENKEATYLMMLFTFVSIPMAMHNEMNALTALEFIVEPETMLSWLTLHQQGILVVSIFWGLWLFPLGYLVYYSPLFHKFLGIALYIGGIGYFVGTCVRLVFPELDTLHIVFETLTMGEMVWVLWIIFVGARKSQLKAA
jgi:hypothetical protein